ncbi:MAG: amidohydrolase family protein [Planctomycetes bacterium]|jgi:imidazolonepropionase-like amidohydrolase|nr:amidohydrolase family protein [Planctomycetota bacterium]MCC7064845.1 amidohydrolase family protein [Planctomycetota bacterium]
MTHPRSNWLFQAAGICASLLTGALLAQETPPAPAAANPAAPAPAATPTAAPEAAPFELWHPRRPATEKDYQVAKWGPRGLPSPGYAFRCAKILPITSEPILDGVVITRNGTIEAIGRSKDIKIPDGYEVIDCGDSILVPGFVELHCHIASESFDLNDTVHATNPEFRTLDLIGMEHDQIRTARAGGISTVLYIPGSGSNMGGFGTLTKTWGNSPEEALVRFPGSLKIAQAGNPERGSGDLGTDMMGMSEGLRMTLLDGKRYWQQHEAFQQGKGEKPKFDPTLELLRGLFRHEYPVSVHTQIYQVVLNTIQELRLELGLWTVIVHGTFDGYRLSENARTAGVAVAGGPRQYFYNARTGRMDGLLANWALGGEHGWRNPVLGLGRDGIGVNTDSPVVAEEQLPLQAAMGVRLGLPHEWALRGLTINAARFVGADHRVGSLEVGKDADLAIWSGDPLDPRCYVKTMVINGTICYRRSDKRPVW